MNEPFAILAELDSLTRSHIRLVARVLGGTTRIWDPQTQTWRIVLVQDPSQ